MTREEAKEFMWIENDKNPLLRWGSHASIRNLVSSLIDKIYDDFENKSCDGCKSIEDSKTLMKGIIPLECMFCIRKNTDNFKKAESIDEQTKNIVS